MTPSDQEALASAQFVKASQRKGWQSAMFVIVIGIAISLVFPPAAICLILGLIIIGKIKCDECEPHEEVLRHFAATRNWYYEPQKELRRVQGKGNRVRFYATAPLLSAGAVADRLISNDFAPRTPPPTGEVPRKQPISSASSPTTSQHSEFHPPQHAGPASSPTSHPKIIWAPVLDDQPPPADQAVKASRRRSPRTLGEATSQSVADLSPAPEGRRKQKTNYAKVRSAKLRKAAIEIHGRNCCACRRNFDEMYGPELAKGYIEIHHLNRIAAGERTTDPVTDLAPLCSNCHTMADRLSPPPRTIAELRYQLFPEFRLQEVAPAAEANKSPVKIRIGKIREKKPKKTT